MPLIVGVLGFGVYIYLEKIWVRHPTVPFAILSHRTSLIGYTTNTIHGMIVLAVGTLQPLSFSSCFSSSWLSNTVFDAVYFMPVYFQSVKGTTALQSGIDLFSICLYVIS